MGITITTDIFCDKCGNWEHIYVGNKAERRLAGIRAKKNGWKRMKINDDFNWLCPDCVREYELEVTEVDS